jgi:ABC-type transport system involved in multi-copper enzyme maturation permease subunit
MRVIVSELIKLRRRGMYVGLGLMIVLGGGISPLLSIVAATHASKDRGPRIRLILTTASLRAPAGLGRLVAGGATLLGVVALVLFAMSFASEFSNGTLRNLLVREPQRLRLFFGKLGGMAVFVSVGVVGAVVLSIIVGYAAAPGHGISTSSWTFGPVGAALGRTLLTTLGWGVLATVLAVAARSPAPAIGAGVVYVLLVDPIIDAAWSGGGRWLPGQLLQAVAQGGTTQVSLTRAAVVVAVYCAGILVAGAALFARRDVTA